MSKRALGPWLRFGIISHVCRRAGATAPQHQLPPADGIEGPSLTAAASFHEPNSPWPRYHLAEVKGHDATSDRPWVTYRTSIYDITNWVATHPSGEERLCRLEELRTRFTTHKWDAGAISTAEWEGVLLCDVLADAAGCEMSVASLPPSVRHVHLVGLEAYAASISVAKALDPLGDILLTFRMNGAPLPRVHGYPLPAMVPGNVAARSIEWVRCITLSDEESPSQWQRRDYKAFCSGEGSEPDWDSTPAI
ncbi:molybdopterin binding oxidoreductase [Colletotrichum falcatum]|nr:molybdopterin binding oxidoreductase [Colletotrichum falcatum]